MTDLQFQLLSMSSLLILAAVFVLILLKLQSNRRELARRDPEFPDLSKQFIDLQERITSEAEETRKEARSHSGNTQTAIKVLTGQVKKTGEQNDRSFSSSALVHQELIRQAAREIGEQIADAMDATVKGLAAEIHADGKKTRKETQEIKTALRDDEKDDQKAKAKARRATITVVKSKKASK